MDLQFSKTEIPCLTQLVREAQTQEQTQEVRLTDTMPDIGSVIGAWGQPIIRSKQWRAGAVGVSGGVMAWVLYAPEDGSEARCVEAWIPFQMSWDLPQSKRDGTIRASCLLKGVDARSVSARKLMVRAEVSVLAEALEPVSAQVYRADEIAQDICVKEETFPVLLAREAGEKAFALEEELSLPASSGEIETVFRYALQPELLDKKVMSDKVVFRGTACVHILCRCEDGKIRAQDFEIPFSQYCELEQEYSDAEAEVALALTNLEFEALEGGKLSVKCGIVGQYVVYSREDLRLASDAYSLTRKVTPHFERVNLPRLLERRSDVLRIAMQTPKCMDAALLAEQPTLLGSGTAARVRACGACQILTEEDDGSLRMEMLPWEQENPLPGAQNSSALCALLLPGKLAVGTGDVSADLTLAVQTVADEGLTMMDAMELGEETAPDPARPSVILRRAAKEGLWDLAKRCGTTVEAIRRANRLTDEPEEGKMLLIPVP